MNWREYVRNVTPYIPGEQPKIDNLIKLNTNENPYSPSSVVKDELKKLAEDYDCLRRYPKPNCDALEEALSEYTCRALCNPKVCSMPGFPVLHCLLEFA